MSVVFTSKFDSHHSITSHNVQQPLAPSHFRLCNLNLLLKRRSSVAPQCSETNLLQCSELRAYFIKPYLRFFRLVMSLFVGIVKNDRTLRKTGGRRL